MSFVVKPATEESRDFQGSGFTSLDGQDFYRIADVDRMAPFFVNVVSHCDIWMYVSSRGGLSAGRVDADGAFFPYETVDRIHDGHHHTGGYAQFWVQRDQSSGHYWEPFSDLRPGQTRVRRQLYKNLVGNQLVFEEIDEINQLIFRSRWAAADSLGIVRTTEIINTSDQPVAISVFDGFRNVLPFGIPRGTYQFASCLTDAYKRTECDAVSGLGIFAATSAISDGTHPIEVLRSNVAWSVGLNTRQVHLSADCVAQFRDRQEIPRSLLLTGRRGNYFITAAVSMEPGDRIRWHLVGDVGYDHRRLVQLRERLVGHELDNESIENAITRGTDDLVSNVASADGLQHSADEISAVHHFANVLFNNMRGGVFVDNHQIKSGHFRSFVGQRNSEVADRHHEFLKTLPTACSVRQLSDVVERTGDPSLRRLACEYLPIFFSRRHGDPSRPWNKFAIRLRDADGRPELKFEGNWRDIFQNWEGLCISFPDFLESVISKFVNGSTVDGFNPYRVTSDGMEWEELDPEDPWSNIGYWGDHQIIYLLKLLEALHQRAPGQLQELLGKSCFAYLDVPYRLQPFDALVGNGRETIQFDDERALRVASRVEALGEDGKLVPDVDGAILHVNLTEKLLVPLLSKLSNFVIEGGIWMNTQRPEWNDANNALVGGGISVVTLCYLRRYLAFCERLFENSGRGYSISGQVVLWLRRIQQTLTAHQELLASERPISDKTRREILDQLGRAFCDYRQQVAQDGLTSPEDVGADELADFCRLAREYADDTIRKNYREDALYHAYNLIEFTDEGAAVRHLYEMLEGQVAVLSSGALSPLEAADLVDALFLSRMYREDQNSFMLYPERQLADFLDRNVIPEACFEENPLLTQLFAAGDTSIVVQDGMGVYRFNADLQQGSDLQQRLENLAKQESWRSAVQEQRDATVALFDNVFQHKSYTGRSGTMYGYEGLGCIYWHMVSKLLLAVQENYDWAVEQRETEAARRLADLYYRVRDGLGPAKTPEEFGAFPTDPYSHTPGHAGARQPGMTGQVKEEILTRFGELGVRVINGQLEFRPALLRAGEFDTTESVFAYVNQAGEKCSLSLPANSLAFTYCQVPVVYQRVAGPAGVQILDASTGQSVAIDSLRLDEQTTRRLLSRQGEISSILVSLPENEFALLEQ